MAECLSAPIQPLPSRPSLTEADIKQEDDLDEPLNQDEKMVMLQAEQGKDSATLLRDILQSEKRQNNNNAGENGGSESGSEKPGSPMQSPLSSTSETEDNMEENAAQKRHRVEDIVLSRLTPKPANVGPVSPGANSPSTLPVNGCKKRKLYQPSRQQVENGDSSLVINDEEHDLEDEPLPVKRSEDREALKARLREHFDRFNGDMKPVFPSDGPHHNSLACNADLERLVAVLKSEITHTLTQVIDDIVSRFVSRFPVPPETLTRGERSSSPLRQSNPPSNHFDLTRPDSLLSVGGSLAHQRDLSMLTQMLDRKAKSKVIDRGGRTPRNELHNITATSKPMFANVKQTSSNVLTPKRNSESPFGDSSPPPASVVPPAPEQTEAMSLVVTPGKKKRHKVTDTRLAPRRSDSPKFGESPATAMVPAYPPPLIPVSLPTSVAIPNPSLHHDLFYSHLEHSQRLAVPFQSRENQDPDSETTPQTPAGPVMPPLASSATSNPQEQSPFGLYLQRGLAGKAMDTSSEREANSEGNAEPNGAPLPNPYESMAMMNFFKYINGAGTASALALGATSPFCPRTSTPGGGSHEGSATPASETSSYSKNGSLGGVGGYTSTLTPMHLRKAKLMFFYVRYPSSAILKMYFPDINFNKNNTAQLVKWFSNFREFYYIQMEKYARQAISEGIRNAEDIRVSHDSELLRVLNLHYNRNNHIDVPENFRFVVEQTLREFFKSILAGKDQEQSWKKAIYKIIARLDDNVPEYFKSPNFLEQLE